MHIYNRHIQQAIEELRREPIDCEPRFEITEKGKFFYNYKPEDIILTNNPKKLVKENNPQLKFDLGI